MFGIVAVINKNRLDINTDILEQMSKKYLIEVQTMKVLSFLMVVKQIFFIQMIQIGKS